MFAQNLYNSFFKLLFLHWIFVCTNSQSLNRCKGLDIGTSTGGTDVVFDGKINGYWKKDSITSFYTDNAQELDFLYFNSKIVNKDTNT